VSWLSELHHTQPIAHAIGVLAFVCVLGMALGSLKIFFSALKERMLAKSHAVIAVAEGLGQGLLKADPSARDASGNVKLKDIGPFLCE
jgi:hypothetical protein